MVNDEKGEWIFIGKMKSSIVDYAITEIETWKKISELEIRESTESDHQPIEIEMKKYIQGVEKVPGRLDISSGTIFFKKVKVIPEVNFNEEFNGDLHFDLEADLHGFLKVKFVFFKWKPPFFTSAIDRAKNTTFNYVLKS